MTEQEQHPVDMLAELALGVLPETQAAPLRDHIAECESCREEFNDMERAARLLPLAVEDVEPSARIKEGLMERIASEPHALRPAGGRVLRWRWVGAVAAAAAALLVAGGVLGALIAGGNGDLKRDNDRQQTLVQAVAQGKASMAHAEDVQSGATATLVRAPGQADAFVWVANLPALPRGKAYQAWFIRDGKAEPSDVFKTADGGVWVNAKRSIDGFGQFGLTIEDEGGAKSPSQSPFIAFELQKAAKR